MNYPVPTYAAAVPAAKSKIMLVIVCIVIFIMILMGISTLAIGLGVGLTRKNSDSSRTSSSSTNNIIAYSILSAPTVTCTYGGSSTCGCSATKSSFLSPGTAQGYTAVANSWPWMVALYIDNGGSFCSGFLVSYQYVITSAYCVRDYDVSTIKVYAGLQKLSALSSASVRTVANKKVHPDYSITNSRNDIAILNLTSSFDQISTIGVCCLTSDTSLPSLGEHGVIAGWVTPTGSSISDGDLLQGVVQVQQDSSCSTSSTSSIQFCAGYLETNSCSGDIGGPFMTSVNNSWTCTGVTSPGTGCLQNRHYTRLSPYRQFIDDFMNS